MKLRVVLVVFGLLAATIGIPSPVVAQAATWDSAVTASSPSHWWKLDNTAPNAPAVDSAGSITATHNSNAIAVPGISGQAAQFGNGSATELLLDGTNTRFDQITAELWFKPDPVFATDRQRLIRHRTHGYHIDWLPNLSAVSANVALETPNGDEWANIELVAVGVDPDVWHHVALTVDTTKISLWVDGNERDTFEFSATNAVGVHYTNDLLTIGNDYPDTSSVREFSGLLDEVVLYDRAITGTEVQSHYTATGRTIIPITATVNGSNYAASIINSGPVAYWQLDDDTTATNVVDSIDPNANNAGISGRRPDFGQPGVFTDSTAIALNDKNEYLSLPGALLSGLETEFTVEMWLKSGSTGGWDRAIRARGHGFGIDWSGGDQQFRAWLHTTDGAETLVVSNPVSLNEWHHVAFVFDGSEIRMVVNGELHNVTAVSGNTANYSGAQFTLGNDSPGNRKRDFRGSIDEVAIYNTALPTTELTGHYTASGRMSAVPLSTDEVVAECINQGGNVFLPEPTVAEINGQTSTYAAGCYYFEDCLGTQPGLVGWSQSVSCSHPVITSLVLTAGVSLLVVCVLSGACLTMLQPVAAGPVLYSNGTITAAAATAVMVTDPVGISTPAIVLGATVVTAVGTALGVGGAIFLDVITHDETGEDLAVYGIIEDGLAPHPADIEQNSDSPFPMFIEPEFFDENGDLLDDPEEWEQLCPDGSKRPKMPLPPLGDQRWEHIVNRHMHEWSDTPDNLGFPDQFFEAYQIEDYPYNWNLSDEENTKRNVMLMIYATICYGDVEPNINGQPGSLYTGHFPTNIGDGKLKPSATAASATLETNRIQVVVKDDLWIWTAFPQNPGYW